MKYRDNRSRSIFGFICRYTRTRGFPPTLGEIARSEGFKSNSGVIRHLDKLEKWGWIERYHGQARSIRILRSCEPSESERPDGRRHPRRHPQRPHRRRRRF